MVRAGLLLTALLAHLAVFSEGHAAWPLDGIVMPGDGGTAFAADGRGGIFFAFQDSTAVYIGQLDGEGIAAPGYPFEVATAPAGMVIQVPPLLAVDSGRRATIAWCASDAQNRGQLFLTRVLDTAVAWTTPLQPVPQRSFRWWWPAMIAGDSGDVYIAWGDDPDSTHVMVTRLTRNGDIAPGWPSGGFDIARARGGFSEIDVESDGIGGAVVGLRSEWEDALDVQRFDPAGNRSWAWSTPAYDISWGFPRTAPDGNGGVFVSWMALDNRAVMAQHISASGTVGPGWPDSGLVLKRFDWTLSDVSVCQDGFGGAFVVWSESIPDNVFVQHIRGDGTLAIGWPAGGIAVTTALDHQQEAIAIPDGSGGVLIAWEDWRYRIPYGEVSPFIQRLTGTGQTASGWVGDGIRLASSVPASGVRAVPDGTGGAFVAWGGWSSYDPLRVQRVRGDGVYGPLLGSAVDGFQLHAPVPNPLTSNSRCDLLMLRSAEAAVDVMDIAGRRVVSLLPKQMLPAGSHRFQWDGRDSKGVPARPGVYFLWVHTTVASRSARLIKLQ